MGELEGHDRRVVNAQDFLRLERKVDKLGEAMAKFLLIEDRQITQNSRVSNVETEISVLRTRLETVEKAAGTRIDVVEKNVAQWVNRGIGIWALAITLWSMYQFFYPHPHV